jgi:hypothetical protein
MHWLRIKQRSHFAAHRNLSDRVEKKWEELLAPPISE